MHGFIAKTTCEKHILTSILPALTFLPMVYVYKNTRVKLVSTHLTIRIESTWRICKLWDPL